MKKTLFNFFLILIVAGFCNPLTGQIRTPAASPFSKMEQTVGLTDITVEYSRPSMKGRTIFAEDGLVPFGKEWRFGANAATKITFSDDVKVEGNELKKGSYAVMATPGAEKWEIEFHEHTSGSWGSYREKDPALTVMVKAVKLPVKVETMTILFGQIKSNSATLQLLWEETMVPVMLEVEVDGVVMAAIEKTLSGPTAGDYYAAGSYYHDNGKDLEQALEWVQKATNVDNPRFWQVRKEALILADLGRTADAIAAAKRSLELAQEAGNEDYVRMNEKSIKEWSMK